MPTLTDDILAGAAIANQEFTEVIDSNDPRADRNGIYGGVLGLFEFGEATPWVAAGAALLLNLFGRLGPVKRAVNKAMDAVGELISRFARRARNWLGGIVDGLRGRARRLARGGATPGNSELDVPNGGLRGAARHPRMAPYRQNLDGSIRTPVQAIALARAQGIEIHDDVTIGFMSNWTRRDADAEYFTRGRHGDLGPDDLLEWDDFLHERTGRIPVRFNAALLSSDEAIAAHIAHEMFEINALRRIFEERGAITVREFNQLVADRDMGGFPNNLHEQAWDAADAVVARMRQGH